MYIIDTITGEHISAAVSKIDLKEIALINKSKRFDFN